MESSRSRPKQISEIVIVTVTIHLVRGQWGRLASADTLLVILEHLYITFYPFTLRKMFLCHVFNRTVPLTTQRFKLCLLQCFRFTVTKYTYSYSLQVNITAVSKQHRFRNCEKNLENLVTSDWFGVRSAQIHFVRFSRSHISRKMFIYLLMISAYSVNYYIFFPFFN